VDAREEIDQVVRGFFSGEGRAPSPSLAAGRLHEWLSLPIFESAAYETRREVEIAQVRIDHVDGASATVTFSAIGQTHVRTDLGSRRTFVSHYAGPVVLERIGTQWKIVDYEADGRRLLDGLHTGLDTRQEQDGLRLRVVAVRELTKGIQMAVEVDNGTDQPVRLVRAAIRTRVLWAVAWVDRSVELDPGERRSTWITSESRSRRGRSPRLVLVAESDNRRYAFDIEPVLDGAPTVLSSPRSLPLGLRLQRSRWILLGLATAIVGTMYALGWGWFAAPALVAYGVYALLMGRGVALVRGTRAARAYFAVGLALIAIGGALWLLAGQ